MRRGFSLIELLVVMAIVALLIALAVPAFASMQAKAASTKCLGNLRQLGVGLNLYLAEHDQRMPPLAAGRSSRAEDLPVIDTLLAEYLSDSKEVFACPADRKIAKETGTSYYWNSALSGQALAGLNFLHLFEARSSIPLMSDKEGWHSAQASKVNILFADGHAGKELRFTTGQ